MNKRVTIKERLAFPGDKTSFKHKGYNVLVRVHGDPESDEHVGVVVEVFVAGIKVGDSSLWMIDDLQVPKNYGEIVANECLREALIEAEKNVKMIAEFATRLVRS